MKSFEHYLAVENRIANEKYVADRVNAIRRNRAREERRRRRKMATIATASALAVCAFIAACAVARAALPEKDVTGIETEKGTQGNYPIVPIPEKVLARMETPAVTTQISEPAPEPDPATEEIDKPMTYSEKELEMLALVIYQEAGGDSCSDDTRLKVGTVVMNRVADERSWLPDTIEEVLLQKGQYGRLHWTGLVWPARAELPQEAHAVARAYECAERILSGERHLPEDVIFQSEYIMGEIVAEQDGFYFCRAEETA